jgi:hypothetical protein
MPILVRALGAVLAVCACTTAAAQACQAARSATTLTTVLELYTSEGCSSCPPADRWLSGLKQAAAEGRVVAQAFHVAYWDSLGWIDRFAAPAHTARQRQIAAANGRSGIYTPQLVRNGRDWRDYTGALAQKAEPPGVAIGLRRGQTDVFEAVVTPLAEAASWAAYWTVTEHGHSSKVKAGENAGELLRHDFVVRQYVPVGQYRGEQRLQLHAIAADKAHPRQVNLVVFEPKSGKPLQALSLAC